MMMRLINWLRKKIGVISLPTSQENNEEKKFSGKYLNGTAEYYYEGTPEKKILHGPFKYKESYRDTIGKVGIFIEGTFIDGRKNGTWIFKMKRHGETKTMHVNYDRGTQEGEYIVEYSRSMSSINFKGESYFRVMMHNGHPIGCIKWKFNKSILDGKFDDDGFPTGRWTMKTKHKFFEEINHDYWENGILKESLTIDGTTGRSHARKDSLAKAISSFILREGYSMEKIISKGSNQWNGNIMTR